MEPYLLDFWIDVIIPTKDIPQANRLDIILDSICGDISWPSSYQDIADSIGYEFRQGLYYTDAA
jgi:hypothetical protein